MQLNRREFLKLLGTSAASLGLSQMFIPEIAKVFAEAAAGNPPVIWLQGQGCSGCSVSLLNSVHPSISEVLLNIISLNYHPTIMAASGELALSALEETLEKQKGKFILIVEGSVPTAEDGLYATLGEKDGREKTLLDWTKQASSDAALIVAVGTCASFGGIPGGEPNPTGAKPVSQIVQKPVVNIPGCPAHPDWIIGTLSHVLLYGAPEIDDFGRPKMFFGEVIHDNCQNYSYYNEGKYAKSLSDEGCLVFLGCKGTITHSDCSKRHWNNGVNWCIGSRAPCIGCCQPEFPDDLSPLYAKLPDEKLPQREQEQEKVRQ